MRHHDQESTRCLMDEDDEKDGEQLFAYFQNGLSLIKELGQLLRKIAGPDTGDGDEAISMEVEEGPREAPLDDAAAIEEASAGAEPRLHHAMFKAQNLQIP